MAKKTVVDVTESEEELISRAQVAVSQCNWVVGECAHRWTQKYARGRTDADFSAMVGLSADQVYQRRRVWETFADVFRDYAFLKWSHFYAAANWDDAPECLQWADETRSTVAEMKAWRRALRGEDLSVDAPPDDWGGDPAVAFIPAQFAAVKDPAAFGDKDRRGRSTRSEVSEDDRVNVEIIGAVARESDGVGGYAPFRGGAGSPAPKEEPVAVAPRPQPQMTPEQLITRMSSALERVNAALSPDVLKAFKTLPEKKRNRFLKAVSELGAKAARLM